MDRLSGKVAIVTGGASGIGAAIAAMLARDGCRVAVADIATSAFSKGGNDRLDGPCDVRDMASVSRFVAHVRDALGPAQVLVNNVGIYPMKPFLETSEAEWQGVMDVNVTSAFRFAQQLVPDMVEAGWGRIINITSNTFFMGLPQMGPYVASKGALIGLTRSLASEFGPKGITVNCVAPNFTRTAGSAVIEARAPQVVDAVVASQAIPRVSVPEDLVGVIRFLASDDAAFMTGQTLVVDGGMIKH